MQQMIQGHELLGRMHALGFARPQRIDPVGDTPIEFGVEPHRVVDATAGLHDAGQDVIDIVDRECVIRAKTFNGTFSRHPAGMGCTSTHLNKFPIRCIFGFVSVRLVFPI